MVSHFFFSLRLHVSSQQEVRGIRAYILYHKVIGVRKKSGLVLGHHLSMMAATEMYISPHGTCFFFFFHSYLLVYYMNLLLHSSEFDSTTSLGPPGNAIVHALLNCTRTKHFAIYGNTLDTLCSCQLSQIAQPW